MISKKDTIVPHKFASQKYIVAPFGGDRTEFGKTGSALDRYFWPLVVPCCCRNSIWLCGLPPSKNRNHLCSPFSRRFLLFFFSLAGKFRVMVPFSPPSPLPCAIARRVAFPPSPSLSGKNSHGGSSLSLRSEGNNDDDNWTQRGFLYFPCLSFLSVFLLRSQKGRLVDRPPCENFKESLGQAYRFFFVCA